jgi:hypothetical protein
MNSNSARADSFPEGDESEQNLTCLDLVLSSCGSEHSLENCA